MGGRVVHVGLDGLDADEIGVLVAGILGQRPEPGFLATVRSRSHGNPFFAEELTAAGPGGPLPAGLQDVMLAHLESVTGHGDQVLRMVAAAGAAVDHRLLVATDVLDGDVLDRALAETVDAQLLVVDPHRRAYRFRHELLREAVEAVTLPGERARLHRSIAAALALDPTLGPDGPGYRDGREIADTLFISKKTVSVHVSNVLRKHDVPNRVEAGRIAQALGC